MSKVFDDVSAVRNKVPTASYDWSFANNLTFQLGQIVPMFCELVPQKTSFRDAPRSGLQFMPMVFPIQTRMKMRVSFFKYPLRALWKDYRDYIGNFRAGLVEPYHDFNGQCPKTGSLYDYLGLPTTRIGTFGDSLYSLVFHNRSISTVNVQQDLEPIMNAWTTGTPLSSLLTQITPGDDISKYLLLRRLPLSSSLFISLRPASGSGELEFCIVFAASNSGNPVVVGKHFVTIPLDSDSPVDLLSAVSVPDSADGIYVATTGAGLTLFGYEVDSDNEVVVPGSSFEFVYGSSYDLPSSDIDENTSPYYDSSSSASERQLKISAYAARAYEGIYNAYYRDNRNNPYYLNGQVEYNRFIPTYDGGADTTKYELHYANWEKDFLTSAVQSPQQGVAPLVGLTTYTDIRTDENGVVTSSVRTALVDEDGTKYGVDFVTDEDGLQDVKYTKLDNSVSVSPVRSLIDVAQSGISINDFRAVNCYQKYLELNMRSGYSYKEIIQNRYDVKVRYDELLMPEFIGGYTRDINVNSVTQQTMREDNGMYADALGSQAGLAGCREGNPPQITTFCDEECIIMGLVTVIPTPVYTQLLPKHFLYRELLDHWSPEFNNIGFQPITYSEVCPVQAFNAEVPLTDTFGYQRPWYEHVAKTDQAHGLFRTNMRNFLMNRVFDEKPELNQAFLTVSPDQLNDVFAVTETTDKIYGQFYHDCTVKNGISRKAIPKLD